jgi:ABC-type transport system involved in cytochrome bd biosynthesis fused ATPase/permease subunit
LSTEPDVRRCKEIVHLLGLGSLLSSPLQEDVYISEDAMNLSGGQAQRIGIARAIYSDAEILIFDEPTAALDPSSAQLLINIINSVLAERTVIVVTHDNLFREHFHSVLSVTRGALLAI